MINIVPKFLLKKVYVSGSLRECDGGVCFDLVNAVGPGVLTRLNQIKLNENVFDPNKILLKIGDTLLHGHEISELNPVRLLHQQKITCVLMGGCLLAGLATITVDLLSQEIGKIAVTIEDTVHL